MLKTSILGGSTGSYFSAGQTYDLDIDPSTCSLVYRYSGGQFSCTWEANRPAWPSCRDVVTELCLTMDGK